MPSVPALNNFGVLPQISNLPRLSGDSFGAGTYKEIQQAAGEGVKLGEGQQFINYYQAKQASKELFNKYQEGVSNLETQIKSQPGNYKNAMSVYAQGESQLAKDTAQQAQRDPLVSQMFWAERNDRSSMGRRSINEFMGAQDKVNRVVEATKGVKNWANTALDNLGDEKSFNDSKGKINEILQNDMGYNAANAETVANDVMKTQLHDKLSAMIKGNNFQGGQDMIAAAEKHGILGAGDAMDSKDWFEKNYNDFTGKQVEKTFQSSFETNPRKAIDNFYKDPNRINSSGVFQEAVDKAKTAIDSGIPMTEASRKTMDIVKADEMTDSKAAYAKGKGYFQPDQIALETVQKYQYVDKRFYQALDANPKMTDAEQLKLRNDLIKDAKSLTAAPNDKGQLDWIQNYKAEAQGFDQQKLEQMKAVNPMFSMHKLSDGTIWKQAGNRRQIIDPHDYKGTDFAYDVAMGMIPGATPQHRESSPTVKEELIQKDWNNKYGAESKWK